MKKSKKMLALLSAALLVTGWTGINNFNHAQTVNASQTTKLQLAHKSRVYNKKGQKLWYYQGHSALLSTKKTVKVSEKPKAITDPRTKRYSFHDKDWNWFSLPYKTIKGKLYYNIGHGGYIKAGNVSLVNGYEVLANQAIVTITKKMFNKDAKTIYVYDVKQEKFVKQNFKLGQKITIDSEADGDEMQMTDADEYANLYHIKGTNQFLCQYHDEDDETVGTTYINASLLPYGKFMHVLVTQDTNLYTEKGEKAIQIVSTKNDSHKVEELVDKKGAEKAVVKELYLRLPGQEKPELFYQLQYNYRYIYNKNEFDLIKAADVKYIYGPQLQIDNTPEAALNGQQLLTTADKSELQALVDQAPDIEKCYHDNPNLVNGYAEQYLQRIEQAKYILESRISNKFDVAKESAILQNLINEMKLPQNQDGKWDAPKSN
ncbi:SLAP domain-containing protein [Lactobacillus sp. ESL0677]|uniref:SLAP domain-containing protein n=1 Tax=Lactobacillus sp. ESL0677 TaxID=2983208 RepID=UPI0023F72276|nr:SLAP domain-containing protein [Lactobacillus sp. ESL0677]WEV37362.1 SLAP domain-containing protein [Lactobacillus sp. ESL0677]